ncbi:MAG TPA: DEAD/DEAH box helicase, partial [Candidatus Eisenbacteria bacterium]|nr:DEAD/DEAH box helicase [Candidatus Eisenbacteria bacterium]
MNGGPGLFAPTPRADSPETVAEFEALLSSVTAGGRGSRNREWIDGPDGRRVRPTELVHLERLPARPASYAELGSPLPDALRQVLDAQGISRLYSHQARAIDLARADTNVVIATGTASGKSLAYNIPILERLLLEPAAVSLYLFPT